MIVLSNDIDAVLSHDLIYMLERDAKYLKMTRLRVAAVIANEM